LIDLAIEGESNCDSTNQRELRTMTEFLNPTPRRCVTLDRNSAAHSRPAIVNGAAGAVIGRRGRSFADVVGFTIGHGSITAIDFVLDPAKLALITIR
jgi:hypothetical protein